jgi:hypothetical protein
LKEEFTKSERITSKVIDDFSVSLEEIFAAWKKQPSYNSWLTTRDTGLKPDVPTSPLNKNRNRCRFKTLKGKWFGKEELDFILIMKVIANW